jgi:nitrous oxide reductase accessory protein NosL
MTAAALLGAGCARTAGPPPIAAGSTCASCGMDTGTTGRFACERQVGATWRVYDSIECLVSDGGDTLATTVWLPDYDQRALHRADSLWIVKGALATPMGGGLVAFMDRGAAEAVANSSHGRVGRWRDLAALTGARP